MAARKPKPVAPEGFTFTHDGATFTIPPYDPALRDDDEPVEGAWVGAKWVPMPPTAIAARVLKRAEREALQVEQYLADVGNALRVMLAHLTTDADVATVSALNEIIQQDSHKEFWEIYRGWMTAAGEQESESAEGNASGSQVS